MAVTLPSVYQDGTATVQANGAVVTGQSTLWGNSVLPGDFFGVHKGYAIRILSVDSNTQLTLANPWPGRGPKYRCSDRSEAFMPLFLPACHR